MSQVKSFAGEVFTVGGVGLVVRAVDFNRILWLLAEAQNELAAVTKDRDEWKEACMDANVRFKDAEEKLRTAYPLSDTLQHWKGRAERAEARIMEAEKQKPFGYLHSPLGRMPDFHFKPDAHVGMEPVYTRPIPPEDVAELQCKYARLDEIASEAVDLNQRQALRIAELERKLVEQQAKITRVRMLCAGEAHPRWDNSPQTTATRGLILDITEGNNEELNKLLDKAREEGRREAVPDGWQVVPKEHAYRQLKFLEVLKDTQSTPAQQPEVKK